MITGQIKGNYVIINNIPAAVSEFTIDTSADIYYEVVRIIDGRFLFLSDHLSRLKHSTAHSALTYPGDEQIRASLRSLLSVSHEKTGNIKILLFSGSKNETHIVSHFVTHFYPAPEMYREGVSLRTFRHTRPQPGVKKWDADFRARVNMFIDREQIYEALLLNEKDEITEGSRSNIFFIDGAGCILTPPTQSVLPGITRKYVIQIITSLPIDFRESHVHVEALDSLAACFLTGTSPMVLPVKRVDQSLYRPDHPVLLKIMESFGRIAADHMEEL